MAQFDVHRNKGPLKESIPFVVIVQSSLFDRYRRRMVVPLVRRTDPARRRGDSGHAPEPGLQCQGR